MPIVPLPPGLVRRLKRIVRREETKAQRQRRESRVDSVLARTVNIDQRNLSYNLNHRPGSSPNLIAARIRAFNVGRNYQNEGQIVIKKTHYWESKLPETKQTADGLVEAIKSAVRSYNSKNKSRRHVLLEPNVHVIGNHLVAMKKTYYPTVNEFSVYSRFKEPLIENHIKAKGFFGRAGKQKLASEINDLERKLENAVKNVPDTENDHESFAEFSKRYRSLRNAILALKENYDLVLRYEFIKKFMREFRRAAKNHGVTGKSVIAAVAQITKGTKGAFTDGKNLLFLGINSEGKLVFMPLIDIEYSV